MAVLLEADNIDKSFSGIPVLKAVDLDIDEGEVHALLGENGAGKSTLMKVLSGIHRPDGGELRLNGQRVHFRNVHDALKAGVAMIYQEPLPFPDLNVSENVFMGQELVRGPFGWIDKAQMQQKAEELLGSLGLPIRATRKAGELTIAELQTLEIAKALAHNARLIIMDEPTSALSHREAEALFKRIVDLRQRGVSIIYISHRLEEVFRLARRCTVLRDGAVVGTHLMDSVNRDSLVRMMVGGEVVASHSLSARAESPIALAVSGLCVSGRFKDISFSVRRGEVLGLAGLMGAGRTDVVNAIYGLTPLQAGQVEVNGRIVRIKSPQDALKKGIGLVSEDRKRFGFVPQFGVRANGTLSALGRCCNAGVIRGSQERDVADRQIRDFRIRTAGRDFPVRNLSGGNQQKTVLARAMFSEPEILLLDEPTRGIDVGAKAEVHQMILELARAGKAIVLVSSDMTELLALSNRIVVMREGRITAEFTSEAASADLILKHAMPG